MWVLVIEATEFRQSDLSLLVVVWSFEEFINIIKDEIILKNWDNMSILIVNKIIDYLNVVIVSISAVLFAETLLHHQTYLVLLTIYSSAGSNSQSYWMQAFSFTKGAFLSRTIRYKVVTGFNLIVSISIFMPSTSIAVLMMLFE